MKKLDKLIIQSFLGPFFLTFVVVVFILLMQYMLKYFDELVGKNLGIEVFAELLFFFSINMTTVALPLAVLLSSLMTFGNLGEHFELTAIKSSGISLTRALVPLFVFSLGLTVLAFFNNDQIVPRANLQAYSLLYDIRQTKPSLALQEGAFYNGIPDFSIKVNKKYPDDVSLKSLILYDHSKGRGNTDVILADSGRMYLFNNDQYLRLDLFNGQSYSETSAEGSSGRAAKNQPANFVRNKFKKSSLIFPMESFNMVETKKEYFAGNKIMKNIDQLSYDLDSMQDRMVETKFTIFEQAGNYNPYVNRAKVKASETLESRYLEIDSLTKVKLLEAENDSTKAADETENTAVEQYYTTENRRQMLLKDGAVRSLRQVRDQDKNRKIYEPTLADTAALAAVERKFASSKQQDELYKSALGQARYAKNNYEVYASRAKENQRNIYMWEIEIHKKWAQAIACLVMFLIGAPLGSIIKRGGLGVPVIISIAFFIVYYVFTMFGEKWAREGIVSPEMGIWSANLVLLPFGLVFLWQARNDARLFESDFYSVMMARFRSSLGERVKRPGLLKRSSS
jgi:lipopolysaccharide export system permease protein